ncbi:MAG: LptF/LptG family permease [Candidatus Eremiobacteraeota bacterium]|nr:LptF/LptG family permease [Candidatus Eremiobacteraeota bacterium]
MASVSGAHAIPLAPRMRFSLPILDIYILHEYLGPFFFALGAFFLFWAANIFILSADYVINQHAPFFLVLRFVVFRIPQSIPLAFPFATLFATLLAIGRLMADNEIAALRTTGVSLWRICMTPLLFGFAAFLVAYGTNEYVVPYAVDQSTRTFYQIIYHTAALPVEPQFFRKDPDTGNVFYVNQVLPDGHTMQGVQVYKPGRTGYFSEVVSAKYAHVEGATLILTGVVDSRYNNDGVVSSQVQTKQISIGLPLGETAAAFLSTVNSDPFTMNSKTLGRQVTSLKAQGVGGTALGNLEINLADKTAFPFAAFVSVIIALPLAIKFGRRGRTLGIALSLLAFFVYYLMNSAAGAFGRNGAINPFLAAWTPNLIFGISGLLFLWREER